MKKSKHFRKDVILARIIAGVALLVLIGLLVFVVSLMTKTSEGDKDSQNTQNTQHMQESESLSEETEYTENTENTAPESENTEPDVETKTYVKTTTQVRLRKEPNTDCATLDRIDGGTKLEVLETLDGWYKVNYNGQEGYVSATYAKIVEE